MLDLSHGRPASSLIESMSMPRRSITWVGPIVSSWAIGDPQIVNHDEEEAEICAALRFLGSHMIMSSRIWSTKLISRS